MQQADGRLDAASPTGRLMLQFLGWVALRRRSYAETMEAWRTSCPRLSVWEDAVADGLVEVDHEGAQGCRAVRLTAAGIGLLRETGAAQADPVV